MGTQMLQRRGTTAEWAAANTILGDGELGYNKNTGEIRMGDGVTAWNALPSSKVYIPRSVLDTLYSPIGAIPATIADAAGDLVVGTGVDTIGRLPKGADGQYLSVVGGALTWITPPGTDLSSRVAKTGDTMSGPLTAPQLRLAADVMLIDNGANGIRVVNLANNTWRDISGGVVQGNAGVYDGANRVYSAGNPPPGAGGVTSVTGTYAVAAGIGVVLANGTFTTTLPAAAANNGRVINIKNTGTGIITVATAGGNIDGTATAVLNTQYASITVVSDGTNWFIL